MSSQISIRSSADVGPAIRLLRKKKGLTGVELGGFAGISQSKISKIETSAYLPSSTEVNKLLHILECPQTIRQQIYATFQLGQPNITVKFRPIPNTPDDVYKREQAATHLRCAIFNIFPALLQTPAYREAVLSRYKLTARDIELRMSETLRRQDLLWSKKHTFHFLIHETALYTRPAATSIQQAQLDRIERLIDARQVKIGIVPLTNGVLTYEHAMTFVLYDERSVLQVNGYQEAISSDPQDIVEHINIFNELNKKALYNQEAKELIRKASQFFS